MVKNPTGIENSGETDERLSEITRQLAAGALDRRTFVTRAMAVGIGGAVASALATQVLADSPIRPGGGKPVTVTPLPANEIEIRIPSFLRLPKNELARAIEEFRVKVTRISQGKGSLVRAETISKEVEQMKVQEVAQY